MDSGGEFSPTTLAALSLSGSTSGLVKHLRGFRKDRHTVPDAVNAATQAFFARLCADELAEEAETWFQRAKDAFAYKRREIALELGSATSLLAARDFTFEITWALDERDPGTYAVTRVLRNFREPEFILGEACQDLFASTFSRIVFTLARGVAVEDVIDAVEALPTTETVMQVRYRANCSECTLSVPNVDAEVRCTGASLEMVFPRVGSPRTLLESFRDVRSAIRLTQSEALAVLL